MSLAKIEPVVNALKLLPCVFVLASCIAKFELSEPDPTEALVYVYRVPGYQGYQVPETGAGVGFPIRVDGKSKGGIALGAHQNDFIELRLNPGAHTLGLGEVHARFLGEAEGAMGWIIEESLHELNVEAGKTYYVEVSLLFNDDFARRGGYLYHKGQVLWKQQNESQALKYLQDINRRRGRSY